LSIESGAFNGLALNQAKPSRFAGRFGAVRSARGSSPRGGGRDGSGHGRDFRGWAWRRTGASGLRLQLDGRLTT